MGATCVRHLLVVLTAAATAAPALGLEARLTVSDDAKVERKAGTVTSGVPFAKGAVKDPARLSVSAGGKTVPAQFEKLAVWDDGSVRWALLDCQADVPAGGKVELVLRDDGKNAAPAAPVKVAESDAEVKMTTGALEVIVDRKKPGLLRVKVGGKDVVDGSGRGPVLWAVGEAKEVEKKVGNRTVKTTEYGPGKEIPAEAPSEVKIEQAGPLRGTVCARGKFPGVHEGLLSYTARVTVYAGQKLVKVHFWLENNGGMGYYARKNDKDSSTGKMEWLLFDGMALELGAGGFSSAGCEGAQASGRFKLLQTCSWTKDNRKLEYNNYRVFTLQDFGYTITGGDGKELKKGDRTDGVVELKGSAGAATVAIRNFWEQYDKGMELDGGKLRFWLWPTEGQWPRERRVQWAGLFDKQLETSPRPGLCYLPGSVHKGHEMILDFSGRAAAETSAELSRPLFALAPADYYASTEAAPALFAPPGVKTGDGDCDEKLAAWEAMGKSLVDPEGPSGLFAARKQSDWSAVTYFGDSTYWYGWMDFGDLAVPSRGPNGLDSDWLFVMLIGAMRGGDVTYLRFASEMARHRIDVDQFWSDRDPPWCNRLQRGDLNFPAFHCYRLSSPPGVRTNHLAGTVLYYMLTGEKKALECAERNAEGLKAAWEQIAKTKPWAGPQGDMSANGWAIHGYCSMYALTGEKKWLEEALGLFRGNVTAKWKGLGPHLHERQQIRSQDYTKDDIKYCYALYPFCLLHYYTGEAKLLEMLKAGADNEFPPNFFDAPLFLADLDAYVALKTDKADYGEKGIEHWLQASPESKCPPVWLPNNAVWGERAAMHLRAGHILEYYFWKKGKK